MALEDLTVALKSATDAQRTQSQRNQTDLIAVLEKATDTQQRNQKDLTAALKSANDAQRAELQRNQQELLNALRANRDAL